MIFKREGKFRIKWLAFLLCLICTINGFAQSVTVDGTIKDATTGQAIPFASAYVKNGAGISADGTGRFTVETEVGKQLVFSNIGYKTQVVTITAKNAKGLVVSMQRDDVALNEVVVSTKKRAKYSNKNNPAVDLIRKIVEHKPENRPTNYDYVEYEQYEKLQIAVSKVSDKITNSKLLRKYHFLFENLDTTKIEGKALIPMYIEEKLTDVYYRKRPEKKKTIVQGDKKVNFGEFVDSRGMSDYLNRLYDNIDIYENNIPVFTNQFLSPIADGAPGAYMFYIRDTIVDAETGVKLVKLYFTPRNTNDLLFRGTLYVTLDGNYAIQKANMYISKNINLNFVREMYIDLTFERSPDGKYHVVKSDMKAEASLLKSQSGGFFGQRTVSYKNYKINEPREDKFYDGPSSVVVERSAEQADSFWTAHRHDTLSTFEAKAYKNMDSLQNMPSFKRLMDWATVILAGYKSFDKFEVGPFNTFYSFNPVEGFRLRAGGRTTPKLSKRFYFEGYGAYGFKDQLWKGYGGFTYSLNNKSIYDYPLKYIQVSAQRETKIPGQELQFVQEDNFLLSFKRGTNDKWLYNTIYKVNYVQEFKNNLSVNFGFKNWRQEPAGSLTYVKMVGSTPDSIGAVTTSELSAEIRWAPHEQFYQGKLYRIPIVNKYPIFTLRYIKGIKGLMNGEYNYDNLMLRIEKRFYLSRLGYTDVTAEGGYVFGQLPYPLLTVHRANQTYAYQLNSYNLMNFLEFVSDHYAGVNVDHYFNGLLFNRVPLLKKLKLREVLAGKVLYGGVRSENNPANNSNLYKFPTDENGTTTTFSLNDGPYVEGSVGIANIFKVLRVDYVRRFTYLEHPDIAKWGIRVRFKFDF
ncbi:MAG: carboxypeptidase-like regulatory domain-containing protein [Filimonas sp.]|nr:carboxypeptidase-like regulatory domain-containing protein [Filimonas sp.]